MPENRAAYLASKSAKLLKVEDAPYTRPQPEEIVIKNAALAVNPLDWAVVDFGTRLFSWLQYPLVLGSDVAGEIVEIGNLVDPGKFAVGDRVVGHAVGLDKRSNKAAEGGFQQYTVLRTNMAARIPADITYEQVCVIPLGLSTAACGLFMKDQLALEFPTSPRTKPLGKSLLVWGGSTSVGCNAIQLAQAAGYEVITTASPKNFEYVKTLGATHVFDYRDPKTVPAIIRLLEDRDCAGALAIGHGSERACVQVIEAAHGRKFVSQASAPFDIYNLPTNPFRLVITILGGVLVLVGLQLRIRMRGIGMKFINGSDLMDNEVGAAIYGEFLPAALAKQDFVPAPEPEVIGHGLEHLQDAMQANKRGVSAKKLIVTLK